MGIFRVDVKLFNVADRARTTIVPQMLVDTGSRATWAPRRILESLGIQPGQKDRSFIRGDGQIITRSVGYAVLQVAPNFQTVDEIVFAEDGDLSLLGARSLGGLNVRVDAQGKQLMEAGPILAAGNIQQDSKRSN
jgi:predicted aspartyl protease